MLRPVVAALVFGALALPVPAFESGTGDRCEPRTPSEWALRCAAPEGRAEIERLLGGITPLRLFRDVDTAVEACAMLRPGSADTECERARRQIFALLLNRESGRLGAGCCVEIDGTRHRLADLLARDEEDCRASRRCAEIRERLAGVNSGERIVRCGEDPAPGGDGCCRPRSKGFWHRQCLGIGALTPGRGAGSANGPGLHPAFTEAELRAILARADRRIGSRATSACDALDEANHASARGRAMAQYAALVLNAEAGNLRGCDSDGGTVRRVERLIEQERWEEAKSEAEGVNVGTSVRRCEGDREDTPRDDGDGDHGDGDHDDSDGKDKDKEKEKKGNGHAYGHDKDKGGKGKGKGKP